MPEWTKLPIAALLDGQWPGEWGTDPAPQQPSVLVYRSTELDGSGHIREDGGANRVIMGNKVASKRLLPGDILLEASGGAPGRPVGRVGLYTGVRGGPAMCSNFLRVLRPKKGVNSAFLRWALLLLHRRPAIWRFQQQTTGMSNLKVSDYLNHRIEFPTQPEQQLIAEILATIDEAIEQTEALIAKTQQIKTGLMQDLFTQGVTPDGELRPPRDEAPQFYKESPLGWIPKDWDVRTLAALCHADITYGIVQAGPHIEGGTPYIRTGDMSGDRLVRERLLCTSPRIAAAYKRSEVRAGEIVCAIRATVGKVLPVMPELDGANLTQGTARIAPNASTNALFLLWSLRTARAQSAFAAHVKGTTFSEITLASLRQLQIAVSLDKTEQELIAARLEACSMRVEEERRHLQKLRQIKAGLMHDLLTGGVRIPIAEAQKVAANV